MENINFKIEERDKKLRNEILITPFYIYSGGDIEDFIKAYTIIHKTDNIELTVDSKVILDNTIDYAKQ